MKEWIQAITAKLQGKKTYIVGGVFIAVALAGVFTGKMSGTAAILIGGYGLSLIPLAAKTNRSHAQLLAAIEVAGVIGTAARTGGIAAIEGAAVKELPVIKSALADDSGGAGQ